MSSSGRSRFALTMEISPIILTNGIAGNSAGGGMPIISLLGPMGDTEDDAFARFLPLPGATLIDQDAAMYPFANQAVAANAVITKPLTLSFQMIAPAKGPNAFAVKAAIMQGLQASLAKHNASGGTYVLATPSFYFENCLMLSMRDVSPGISEEQKQAQLLWQLDFVKPLLTLQDAQAAQNAMMSKVSGGTQIKGQPTWSGIDNTVGNPNTLAQPSTQPDAQGVGGAGITSTGPG